MSIITAVGIGALILLLPIFFLKKEYGLYALLIVRPLVDLFSSYTIITYHSLTLNLNAIIALLVIAWFISLILKQRLIPADLPGKWWLGGLIIWSALSSLISIDVFNTLSEFLRLLSLAIIFIVAYQVAKERPHALTRLVPVLAVAMALPVMVALWQLLTATGLSFGGLDNRVYGTFGHPNVLGFYLVITLSLLLLNYSQSLLYPWLIAPSLLALLFTYTRGAYLGFAVVQIILGLKYYRKYIFIGMGVITGLVLGWQLLNSVMISTFNYNLNDNDLLRRVTIRAEEVDSIDWRVEVFKQMAPKTLQSPFLGYGLGNFVTLRQQGDIGLFDDPEAHNDYLRLAVEIGFVGLLLYLFFWISLLKILWQHYRAHQETDWPARIAAQSAAGWQKKYALLGMAIIIAVLGMSIGDNVLQGTAVMWTALALLATLLVETRPVIR